MSTHLTDKEIDNYVSGLGSENDAEKAAAHLELCIKCRKTAETLMSAIFHQGTGPVPGEHIRKRIHEEWHRIHNDAVIKHEERKPVLSRLTAGFAFTAVILVMISGYLIFNKMITDGSYPLELNSIRGETYLNDTPAVKNTILRTGDIMKTGNNASAIVSLDGYSLSLGKSTSLEVMYNNKGDELRFKLIQGSVLVKSSGIISYSFECGDYRIIPAGTDFILDYSKHKLAAAVLQGKIAVSDLKSRIEIPAGMMWSSDNPEMLNPLDEKMSALLNAKFSEEWQIKVINTGSKKNSSGIKNSEKGPAENIGYPDNESSSDENEKNNKEKLRIKSEIRDDLKEMKREQRREKKGNGSH